MSNNSPLFMKIGLGNLDLGILLIIAYVLIIAVIVLFLVMTGKYNRLKSRYERFMMGSKAVSLEKDIQELTENVNILIENDQTNADDIKELYRKHRKAFQKMGLVKYDAFKEMGGNLSFSLALLDENNDGLILNSVHSSTGCYSYTKDIKQGKCSIELSAEESSALAQALAGIK